jgi:hypothetical protein
MRSVLVLVMLVLSACAARSTDADVDVEADEATATSEQRATSTPPVPWSVSRHIWPSTGAADDALLEKDLGLIAGLGARFVRADVWWYVIEPERGRIDAAALASYSRALDEARRHGLEVLVVLSNAPAWARALYEHGDRQAFYDAFRDYSSAVARMAGARVRNYQLWNEPNHALDFVDGDGDLQLFARGKAGVRAGLTSIGLASHRFTTMLNVLVDGHDSPIGPSWTSDVRFYMDHGAAASIDVIGIDHYPGTWSFGDWGGNILDRLGDLGRTYAKAVAVLETGFSTTPCTLPFNSEGQQARWIGEQLPRMRSKARALERSGVHVAMFNWFKIEDRDTHDCFDPEDHFGVVRSDRTKKPAYDALRKEIGSPP